MRHDFTDISLEIVWEQEKKKTEENFKKTFTKKWKEFNSWHVNEFNEKKSYRNIFLLQISSTSLHRIFKKRKIIPLLLIARCLLIMYGITDFHMFMNTFSGFGIHSTKENIHFKRLTNDTHTYTYGTRNTCRKIRYIHTHIKYMILMGNHMN